MPQEEFQKKLFWYFLGYFSQPPTAGSPVSRNQIASWLLNPIDRWDKDHSIQVKTSSENTYFLHTLFYDPSNHIAAYVYTA